MKNKITRSFILSSITCLLPFAVTPFIYGQLPDQMVTNWGFDGRPNGYGPKAFAVIGLPLVMLAMNIILHFSINTDPKSGNASKTLKSISRWIAPVMSIGVYAITVAGAFVESFNPSSYVLAAVGLMIMLMGNYLPKSRQSYTVGIKTPWALHDEENWNKTHKLAGPLWVAGGFIMAIGPWIPFGGVLSIVAMSIAVTVPFVYSYLLYRRAKREG